MEQQRIAIVDDDEDIRELVSAFFRQKGYSIHQYESAVALMEDIDKKSVRPDVIISDLMLPQMSGIELVNALKERRAEIPVIVITAHRSSEKAIEAIEAGAYDFVIKPMHFPQLQISVERALHFSRLKSENQFLKLASSIERGHAIEGIVGKSAGLLNAVDLAKRVANSSANVFISGETGTGKEVIARTIHNFGPRKNLPFLAINCSAIPETLLESELFGHAKGSFTGATEKKVGLFEEAGEGTLFLDEIGDLTLSLQSKLLRVLQERKIKRIGENQLRPVRARIISATHKDLRKEIQEKNFREDLFFRLNVIPIHIPPLRERREDIVPLAEFFLKKFALLNGVKVEGFQKSALDLLLRNPWTGNVRELENTVERAVVLCQSRFIEEKDLILSEAAVNGSAEFTPIEPLQPLMELPAEPYIPTLVPAPAPALGLKEKRGIITLEELITAYIHYALKVNHGAKDKTAKDLGIDRKTLYRRLTNEAKKKSPESTSSVDIEQEIMPRLELPPPESERGPSSPAPI